MKQIFNNSYLKSFKFSSYQEVEEFLDSQKSKCALALKETFGNNYFCYVCYHSLTRDVLFTLTFSSDADADSFNFLFWDEPKLFVLDTGEYIYLLNDKLSIVKFLDITTPLIGLYLVGKDRLLILEEAFLRLVDAEGKVIKSELFDLILDFGIKNDRLFIKTDQEERNFELSSHSCKPKQVL